MIKNNLIQIILVAVIVSGLAFFAGIKYQQSKTPAFRQMMDRNGTRPGINQTGIRPINGTILSIDEQSLTVELPDGSTKIVFIGTNTKINKASPIEFVNLNKGDSVNLFGTQNSDGSITAQTISAGEFGQFRPDQNN